MADSPFDKSSPFYWITEGGNTGDPAAKFLADLQATQPDESEKKTASLRNWLDGAEDALDRAMTNASPEVAQELEVVRYYIEKARRG